MAKITNYNSYGEYFSVDALWSKIKNVSKKAGIKVIYAALLLYYIATDSNTPMADKAKIYGVLGYFILPLDLMPDALPFGFSDDMTALMFVLNTMQSKVTPSIKQSAKRKLEEWFGHVNSSDLELF